MKDMPMTPEQLRMIMQKGFKACRSAELQLLPPILYQLLLLSGSGARPFALKGLMALFDHLEAQPQHKTGDAPSAVLLQIEAIVLMHINTMLKYDGALGTDWLKHFKSGGLQASPFLLQVTTVSPSLLNCLGQRGRKQHLGPSVCGV
eukprot:jgi/Chrzof1/11318/Cz05g32090.t1